MITLPPRAALLLDLDGTLIDIAPTPDSVVVPPDLPATLLAVRDRLDGALAVISGRPIAQIDALLPGIATATAGEHGYAIRHSADGTPVCANVPPVPESFLDTAAQWVAAHLGAILERKARGFVLHYRQAPQAGAEFAAKLAELLAGWPHHRVTAAHMAWEVKPHGIDKGRAVREIMAKPPFLGRVPVFIGDDVTDEDGIAAAEKLGGFGMRVPNDFANAAAVRAWLAELAD
jgi:trehalose 6-phosphate phosphatase